MRRALLVPGLAGLLSCGGDDSPSMTGPNPGPLDIRLHGPVGAGAVLLIVEGGTIDSVEATSYFTASTVYSGVARRVLVAGDNLNGVLARIEVPDRRTTYQATVIEVADGTTFQLRDSTSYTLTIEKP